MATPLSHTNKANSESKKRKAKPKPMTKVWQKIKDIIVYKVFHADDPPHRVALGFALGVFVAFTPTIPLQTGTFLLLAWLLKANKAAGIPPIMSTNVATAPPVYFFQYLLGCYILQINPEDVDFYAVLSKNEPFWEYLEKVWNFMLEIFWPLWTGSLVASSLLAIISYVVVRKAVIRYRYLKKLHHQQK